MKFSSSNSPLPTWFVVPVPRDALQQQPGLFDVPIETLLPRLCVSPDELARWHQKGWISSAPSFSQLVDEFSDPRVWEIVFVRDIVRCGLSDAQIEWLFAQCPKPFAFDPDRIAYSFIHGWVEGSPPSDPDSPDQIIEEHLDSWLEECDDERLEILRDQIDAILKNRPAQPDL